MDEHPAPWSWPRCIQWFVKAAIVVTCLALIPSARADAVVTLCQTADDAGPGVNLRNAVSAKPNNTGVNAITFQCGGPATIQVDNHSLLISQSTTIDGGNTVTLERVNQVSPLIFADQGSYLYLYNISLRNPNPAIRNCSPWELGCVGSVLNVLGNTELHQVQIDSSIAPIFVWGGTLGVFNSKFTGNNNGGFVLGIASATTTIDQSVFQNNLGTAPILATGTITVTNSQLSNNGTSVFNKFSGPCKVTIDRDTFENHTTGALIVGCDADISRSTFADNTASNGGAIFFTKSAALVGLRAVKFLRNQATGDGGAISFERFDSVNETRSITITHGVFADNHATVGGAMALPNPPPKTIPGPAVSVIRAYGTVFTRNFATTQGGAIYGTFTQLEISQSVFSHNFAARSGGAVALNNVPLTQSWFGNTLFVNNTSDTAGSAFSGDNASFINSTVATNFNSVALSIFSPRQQGPGPISFSNTILTNNPKGSCGPSNQSALFKDNHNNLQYPVADCGASIRVANPQLDKLYIPIPKSPPMGAADLKVCMTPPIGGRDVYGMARPSGGVCTIGAAEGNIRMPVPAAALRP